MKRQRRFLVGFCVLLAAAGALAGCTSSRPPPTLAFSQPPPLPRARPPVPAGFEGGMLGIAAEGAESYALGPSSYRVEAGDNVFRISQRFGLPVRSLIDANELTPPFTLRVGQRLTIPRARLHEVASGDTVYGISRRYGVDIAELVRLNRIAEPYTIKVGQRLVLPDPPSASRSGEPAVVEAELPETRTAGGAPLPQRNPERQAAVAAPSLPAESVTAARPEAPPTTPSRAVQSAKRAAVPKPPPRQGGKFLWPVQGRVLSGYGPKGGGQHNDGINIAAARGAPILAAENGVVAYAGNELRGFGNLLLIKHSDGWVTAYAHTEALFVQRGQTVRRGQEIGRVGSSGNVSSPQLHFEIRKGTRAIDPTQVLAPRSTAQAG